METYCSECGMAHEVGESQKNSQMFCLGCDNFFKVKEKSDPPKNEIDDETAFKKSVESLDGKEKNSINKKIKTAFKQFFAGKKESPEPELEADPPQMPEALLSTETRSFALIDDFLDPETDFENEPEDVPAEYIDFLSVGLDISSSDLLENHDKNNTEEYPPQKEQE